MNPGSQESKTSSGSIGERFDRYVVPSYGRFPLVLDRGEGCHVWDTEGRAYLDFGGGIAVNCLGHAHPELAEAIRVQALQGMHFSNLYYHEKQAALAEALVGEIGPGKCFFCNSGAEANEGLFKLARRFGHQEGRFEILTAEGSFHGRTLAGMAATGQSKVKEGFGPGVPGFRHVPLNDLDALQRSISPATVAVLVEGLQGEGGVRQASPDYLIGLRRFCDDHRLLLLMDEVQAGHFRTGRFHSYQRILEETPGGEAFLPDAVAMAKSLGGGFPVGAFWVRQPYADLLGPGTHATTYGGSPLACAAALKVLEVVRRDRLPEHARRMGELLIEELKQLIEAYPETFRAVRGLGLLVGLELNPDGFEEKINGRTPAAHWVHRLHQHGLLAVPAGPLVVRFLPPLNVDRSAIQEAVRILKSLMTTSTQ